MRLVVVHVLGSTEASMREIAATAAILIEGGEHILVKNHATDGQFFEWDAALYDSYFKVIDAQALLDIPHLDGMACDAVEKRGTGFRAFIADETNSRLLRGVVAHWLGAVGKELDRAKLITTGG